MDKKKKPWIGKLLMEFASVVFAVLLALGLNHWREAEAERKVAEKALINVFLEVHINQKDVANEITTYSERIEEVRVIKDLFDNREGEDISYSLGFNLPLLSNSAWNVANNTGAIKDFELELLMELSDIYAFQEMYQRNGMDYLQKMNSVEYKKEANAAAILDSNYGQLNAYRSWSEQLSDMYLEFLKSYGNKYRDLLPDSILTNQQ
ncbi:MAG: hypothetical protein ABJF04_11605 [Reichenbachiella sp.]|uniref:hypothetical protein n=1 Tax=Reichenbachiella sp. TaxID=2184521 RepID=UPI003263F980